VRGWRADTEWVRRVTNRVESEQGSILLEALVSGILLVITAVGVFSAFEASSRSTAEERHRAQAEGLAQADLTRMRTMRISDLSNLQQTKVVTIEKTPYTIKSAAEYETDKTGTASCEKGTSSADYIQIRSTITWPSLGSRNAVVEQSLVAPPNGSISEHSGSLAIQVEDAENNGIEGVGLTGTGPASFFGTTGETGCVIFGNLPEGNTYMLTPTITGTSLVDKNGEAPKAESTSVVGESTNTLALQYDESGIAKAIFTTTVGGKLVPSKADAIVLAHEGMKVPRVFGSPGTRQEKVEAKPLFPFTSPYSVYAGTCNEDNPGTSAPDEAFGEAEVTPGGEVSVAIQLPPLNLTAWSGKKSSPGTVASGAEVKVTDTKCKGKGGQTLKYVTEANGHLEEPGLPYSTYEVCVSNGTKHVTTTVNVPENPEKIEAGTTLSAFLGSSSNPSGKCP
jgi:Tfp pilus assembly protein PilV